MKQNQDYKNEALASLSGNWSSGVLATLVCAILFSCFSAPEVYKSVGVVMDPTNLATISAFSGARLISFFWSLFILPILLGLVNSFKILMVDGDDRLLHNTFSVAFSSYFHKLWTLFIRTVFTVLWTLLLIIPGIIKALSYSMTSYILVDYPELSALEAIGLSEKMMKGRKFDLFFLYLSFIGWFLLSLITCGIGFLWLYPYIESAVAAFYLDVKKDYTLGKRMNGTEPAPAAPAAPAASAPVDTPSASETSSSSDDHEAYMPKQDEDHYIK